MLMRQALALALNHTGSRLAFGTPLARQPMMANVLADMAIEVEAAAGIGCTCSEPSLVQCLHDWLRPGT